MILFNLDLAQLLSLLSAIVLPLVVGIVTTRVTSPGAKAVLLAALSFAINLLAELAAAITNGTQYDLGAALLTGLGTFLIAVGVHYGFWRPTGTSAVVQEKIGRHAAS
jgi:phosphotransferase system  glucose/maltose/N-acetylglucosamine-specific IIC component